MNCKTLPDLAYDDTGAADGGPEFPAEEACCCCWRSCCSFWKNMFLRASRRCCRLEGRFGSIVTSLLLSQHSFPVPEKSLSTPALLLWPHATSLFLETPSATASVSLSEIQVKSDYISGLVTNSVLFCGLFITIKDWCKKGVFNKRTVKVCANCM